MSKKAKANEIFDEIEREPCLVWPLDTNGRLINLGELSLIQSLYQPPCDFAADRLQKLFGVDLIATYIRGSVAVGTAVPPFSDLDLVVVNKGGARDVSELCTELVGQHPFLESVDIAVVNSEAIFVDTSMRKFAVALVTQSKLVAGIDIRGRLPPRRPNATLAHDQFPDLGAECAWLECILEGNSSVPAFRGIDRSLEFWARWSMRNVLRTFQLITMLETAQYSSHLGSCARLSLQHFPEFSDDIAAAYWAERHRIPGLALATLRRFKSIILPIWNAKIVDTARMQ